MERFPKARHGRSRRLGCCKCVDCALVVPVISPAERGTTGTRLQSLRQSDIVRSVAADRDGVLVAMGCDDGRCVMRYFKRRFEFEAGRGGASHRCVVHDLSYSSRTPIWTQQHKAKVWVVAVMPNGKFVAAGDYANCVRVYDAAEGATAWEKTEWLGQGSPYTWGLAFSGDSL